MGEQRRGVVCQRVSRDSSHLRYRGQPKRERDMVRGP
jgi:hypothetical protein